MKSKVTCMILSVLILLAFKYDVFASVFADTYGYSAKGIAMGNAMTAVVNDWSSVFYNVSGLGKTKDVSLNGFEADAVSTSLALKQKNDEGKKALKDKLPELSSAEAPIPKSQLAISYFYTQPLFRIDINRYDETTGTPLETNGAEQLGFGAMVLGVAFDLNTLFSFPGFISSARLGLGLGSIQGGYAQKMNDIDQRTHNFLRYGREAQKSVIIVGLGLGFFNDAFGIGVGGNVTFAGQGTTMLSGTEVGPAEQTPMIQNRMDLRTQPMPVAGIYVNAGRLFSSLEGLQIGIAYRHETYVQIDPFATRNQLKVGTATMDLQLALLDFYTPFVFSGGIAYDFSKSGLHFLKGLIVSLEVQYEMWSRYKNSAAVEKLYAKLVAEEGAEYILPDFQDIIVPKIGFAYTATSWLTLYAGYYYQPTFVPDDAVSGIFNYLDNNKHVGSFGVTFRLPRFGAVKGLIEITLAFQAQYLQEREVVKTNPTGYNPDYSYGGWNPTGMIEVSLRM